MKALTSLDLEEFEALVPTFEARWLDYIEKYTFNGKPRLNKYRPQSDQGLLSIEEKLFFILVFHKQNPTQEFLAFSFDLEQGMVNKWIKVLLPILEKTLHQYHPEEKASKINDILHEKETYRLDVTERPVQRDAYEQENFYTGKKKRHSIKNLVLTDKNAKIIYISPTYAGKIHDKRLAEQVPFQKECTILCDLAFYAWELPPAITLQMPHKKPKNQALSKLKKVQNRLLSRERVRIENVFAHVKTLKIVKDTIRNYIKEIKHTVFKIAVALYNFRRTFFLQRKIIYL